jgi:hypothetical protein
MQSKFCLVFGLLVTGSLALVFSGCGNHEDGMKPFVAPSPAQQMEDRQAEIKSVQDNPKIPDDQKAKITALYQGTAQVPGPKSALANGQ